VNWVVCFVNIRELTHSSKNITLPLTKFDLRLQSQLMTQSPARTTFEKIGIVLPPAILAFVESFHARGHTDAVYETLGPQIDRWLVVHYLQLILFPLTAWAVYQLTAWQSGKGKTLLAISLATFAIGYAGFDSIAGIGTGVLVKNTVEDMTIPGAPASYEEHASLIIQSYYHSPLVTNVVRVAVAGAIIGLLLTMFRLYSVGVGLFPLLMLGGACWGVTRSHAPPYGPITYGFIFAAAFAVMWPAAPKSDAK